MMNVTMVQQQQVVVAQVLIRWLTPVRVYTN